MEFLKQLPKDILSDKKLRALAKQHGAPQWQRGGTAFRALLRSVIHQQVSTAAAKSIERKFFALFRGTVTPKKILTLSNESLRGAGLSARKVSYIKDIAEHFAAGHIRPARFARMSNEEIIGQLTKIRGVGVWTAHMFLMFTLHRPDILPTLDLGIRKGFQAVYDLRHLPLNDEMEAIARPWRKYASIASWYLWRAADALKPAKKKKINVLKK